MKQLPLSDFVEYQNKFITINDGQEYTRVTTRLHSKGVVLRDVAKGEDIKTKKQQVCEANQLLVAEIDAKVGGYGIVPHELKGAIVSSHYFLFNIHSNKLLPEYLAFVLRTRNFFSQIKAQGSTNYAAIRPKDILKIEIPYCDVGLQRVVVDKLNTVTTQDRRLAENILREKDYVGKLRHAILREAISGAYAPPNPPDEPASGLLRRIKIEKQQQRGEGKVRKQDELPPISESEIPFVIPNGWEWARLGDICYGITSGSTPEQSDFRKEDGIPYLKVYNIVKNKIDFVYKPQFIDKTTHQTKNRRSILFPGDVIMNIVGPPLGKIAIIPNDYPEWNCNQAIVFFRPILRIMNEWIYLCLCEGSFLKAIELIGTAGQDNISVSKSKKIVIPIPPISVQEAIIQRVEKVMGRLEELEGGIRENQKRSEKFMAMIFEETFEFQ
jgi:restriction endonuclease S subunit